MIQLQSKACVWLVNGATLTSGALTSFTNQIEIAGNQLNCNPGVNLIQDDGGDGDLALRSNNYNGGTISIRCAGRAVLTVDAGQFEAATDTNIFLSNLAEDGTGVGPNGAVIIQGAIIAPTINNHAIEAASSDRLVIQGNTFGNTQNAAVALVLITSVNTLFSRGNSTSNQVGPVFSAYATIHDDGSIPVRTEAGTAISASLWHTNSQLLSTNGSPIAYTVVANGTAAFPIGTLIDLARMGAGSLTVAAAGGVTVNSQGSLLAANGQYANMRLIKTATNSWLLTGNRA